MKTLRFKTNIMCGGCIEKVTPKLNALAGEKNWKVDTTTPNKILEVNTDKPGTEIIEGLKSVGYNGEEI